MVAPIGTFKADISRVLDHFPAGVIVREAASFVVGLERVTERRGVKVVEAGFSEEEAN